MLAQDTLIRKQRFLSHQLSTQYGFILVHRSSIQHFSQTHFSIFQYTLLKQTTGNKNWEQQYHLPRVGFNVMYTNFAHNTLLNSAFGAQACIDFSKRNHQKSSFHFRLGCGLGYIRTPFDKERNYKNIAIGSHWNGLVQVSLSKRFQVSPQIETAIQVSLIHFSNGAIKVPNLGINILSGGCSFRFQPKPFTPIKKPYYRDTLRDKKRIELLVGGGLKQNYPAGSPSFGVTALRVQGYFLVKQKKSFSAGIDLFYDNGIYARMRNDGYANVASKTAMQIGVNLQYQQEIGKFSIPLFWGAYAFNQYKGNGVFYHGTGLKYRISKHLTAGIILKTHFAKADYFWWHMGYRF